MAKSLGEHGAGAERDTLATLTHGLDALRALNLHPLLTAREMGNLLGVSRTAARRLLDTLVSSGVAEKISADRHYRLAPGVADLSSGLSADTILAHAATRLLHDAAERFGWTISLVTLIDTEVVLQVTTAHAAPYAITVFPIGDHKPVETSQAGRVLLAFLENPEGPPQPGGFDREQAQQIREQGFHAPIDPGLRESHLYVPLFLSGYARGCLIMRYMVSSIPRQKLIQEFVPRLKDLAEKIAEEAKEATTNRIPAWLRPYSRT